MALVDRMVNVYNRAYKISDKLGVPQHVDLHYKDRETGTWTEVSPRPRSYQPGHGSQPMHRLRQWLETSGIELNDVDLYITGVSRTFLDIQNATYCKVNDKLCSVLWVDDAQTVTVSVLVRPERLR